MNISREEFEGKYQATSRDKIIDYKVPREDAVAQCEWFVNNPYVREIDKSKFLLMEEVIKDFPFSITIEYGFAGNTFEEKDIEIKYIRFKANRVQHKGFEYEIEAVNRISILWLNEEFDSYYEFMDFYKGVFHYCEYFSKFPSVEEYNGYKCEYDWVKNVEAFDYGKSVASDKHSKENYFIIDLLIENYFQFNNLLGTHVNKEEVFSAHVMQNRCEMYRIYKKYGNDVFGKNINDNYVIENYNEMFGELDKMIMEENNLAQKDFR